MASKGMLDITNRFQKNVVIASGAKQSRAPMLIGLASSYRISDQTRISSVVELGALVWIASLGSQ
jgi:hypothetical protein